MPSEELKRAAKRAEKLFAKPNTLDRLCELIANGGSPIKVAGDWKIPYSYLIRWIYSDEKRKNAYEGAIVARSEWLVQRVLDELRLLALADLRQAFDETGKLKSIQEMPEAVARAIAGIESAEIGTAGFVRKVKFNDKNKSLELLGKNLKMFVEQVEIKGDINFEEARKKAQERVKAAREVGQEKKTEGDGA